MGCRGLFVAAVFDCRNKNLDAFATFLRLGTPFRLCKAKTGYRAVAHLRFCAADLRPGALRQFLIAKKLQSRPVFVFVPLGRDRGGVGLAHVALVTHRKESNAIGGQPWCCPWSGGFCERRSERYSRQIREANRVLKHEPVSA